MGLGYSVVDEDRVLARKSILRVAEYPLDRAVFGAGKPLYKQASARIKEHFLNASCLSTERIRGLCQFQHEANW